MRVALRLAYDGSAFDSYARQPGRRTVEGALLEALAGEGLVPGSFRTGSRTDAKVSALGNVCAVDLGRPHVRGLLPAVQRRLPDGLWVTGAAEATASFDPRKAAWRQYRYLAPVSGEAASSMQEAARAFVGTHHLGAFARLEAGRDPHRTVLDFAVALRDGLWEFRVRGQSFLWNQVRRMAGAVLAVGRLEATPADIRESLASGRPHPRFALAPPEGLLLEHVHYEGLDWDPEAGHVQKGHTTPALVAGHVRLEVARHVAGLAVRPGPRGAQAPSD